MKKEYTKVVEMKTKEKYAEANQFLTDNFSTNQIGYDKGTLLIVNGINNYKFTIKGFDEKKVNKLESQLNAFNQGKK